MTRVDEVAGKVVVTRPKAQAFEERFGQQEDSLSDPEARKSRSTFR